MIDLYLDWPQLIDLLLVRYSLHRTALTLLIYNGRYLG